MLGLQNSYNITKFANGSTGWYPAAADSCPYSGHYRLALVGVGESVLSVVMLDCDDFKAFNDHYGHFTGDECLRRLADSLADQVRRPADIVARFGGEEFVILLPNTAAEDALRLTQRARQDIADLGIPHAVSSRGVVTISCGVASTVPHADQTPLALMEAADQALYRAKASGRNRCEQRILPPPVFVREATWVELGNFIDRQDERS